MTRPTSPKILTNRHPLHLPAACALLVFTGGLMLAPAAAGDAWIPREPIASPRFYIEDVAVEGIRNASAEVILSESRLENGRPYTETELRDAISRIQRLPFLLDARFSLAKGSERGRYRLLINVRETETFFFGGDLVYNAFGGPLEADSAFDDQLHDTFTAGARFFAGNGVFFAAVGDGEDLQVGYTRYQLQGRPVLLRLALARESCCQDQLMEPGLDPAFGAWSTTGDSDRVELTLGIPLGGNHSLRFDASHLETESAARTPLGGAAGSALGVDDVEQRELELAWVYDTTDDPVFPNSGDAVTAAIGLRQLEGDLSRTSEALDVTGDDLGTLFAGPLGAEMSSRLVGLSLYGARHWPLSARQTVSLSLKLLLSRSEIDNHPVPTDGHDLRLVNDTVNSLEADLGVRYSVSLWGPRQIRRLGELRWETVAGLLYLETSPVFETFAQPVWGVSASTSLALRSSWGIFRIGFAYLDYDGGLYSDGGL